MFPSSCNLFCPPGSSPPHRLFTSLLATDTDSHWAPQLPTSPKHNIQNTWAMMAFQLCVDLLQVYVLAQRCIEHPPHNYKSN